VKVPERDEETTMKLSSRRPRLAVIGAAVCGLILLPGGAAAYATRGSSVPPERPVGIVDATPNEQAAVLSLMHVTSSRVVDGYTFWVGTIDGAPVVNVAGGEDDNAAELVTALLDQVFTPRAMVFAGTAGSANNHVNVGDVVLGGFVLDKRAVEYGNDGAQTAINAAETHDAGGADLKGALVVEHDHVFPTPADARTYNSTSHPRDPRWDRVLGFAATRVLVDTARAAAAGIGSTPLADATGNPKATGSVANKIIVGTIGAGAIWTNPLSWTMAQNGLIQTDAEEDEGVGFAFANAMAGVPWTLARGISDTQ
jgi:adenosylhomocysteine nucleosidase